MNILIITPSYKPAFIYGGPSFSISKYAEALSEVSKIQVITTTANGKKELDVEAGVNMKVDNVNVIYFKRQTKDHSHFSFSLLMYVWLNCKKYDLIHIQTWWNFISIFSVIICLLKNCKIIVSPRGMLSNYTIQKSRLKSITHTILRKIVYNRLNLHLTSHYELLQTKELNAKSNYNIPNFLLSKKYSINHIEYKQDILFLSRIEKKKNIEALIKAMQFLPSSVELNIAGNVDNNYLDYLKKLIPLTAIDRVNWLGQVYGDEKYKLIAKSKLLVLPSYDENFANVILESLLNGTAVVISKNVGLSDFVLKYNLGWVFDLNDKLEDVLNEALLDEVKLTYVINNAREIVLREFDDEKLTKQYLEMYTNVINNQNV